MRIPFAYFAVLLVGIFVLVGCERELAEPFPAGPPAPTTQPAAHPPAPLVPKTVPPFAMSEPDTVLLITGGSDGLMEVCDCPHPAPGGLTRRGGLIASYRAAFDPVVLLDAGDVLWIEPTDRRNREMLRGYEMLGYDAVALGDQEWQTGADWLSRWAKKIPLIASNVTPAKGKTPAWKVWLSPAGNLAVFAVTDEEAFAFTAGEVRASLTHGQVEPLRSIVEKLKTQGRTVAVVAHGQAELVERIADLLQPDLIIRGHTRKSIGRLDKVGPALLVQVGGGEHVAAVALRREPTGRIAEAELRLEVVDDRWPADMRLHRLFRAYARSIKKGK